MENFIPDIYQKNIYDIVLSKSNNKHLIPLSFNFW